jgi:hypothetical protein
MLPAGAGGTILEDTVTLYLGLKPGEKADFEVVGLSAAAFAEAVKEIAFILDLGTEISLEFDSGTEGSLKLKAIVKSFETPESRRAAIISIIATVGLMLVNDLRGYGVGKLLDRFLTSEQRQELSDDDVDRIARAVADIHKGKIAKAPVQRMYRQLERDAKIESVGAITKQGDKPIDPVPRSEFPARAGLAPAVQTSPRNRLTPSTERLTLVSPVLLHAHRVWRFFSPFGEFSYLMEDEKFLNDLLTGKRRLAMKEGIQITADIITIEIFEGDIWVPKQRHIMKVRRVHQPSKPPPDLFSEPKKRKARKAKKR